MKNRVDSRPAAPIGFVKPEDGRLADLLLGKEDACVYVVDRDRNLALLGASPGWLSLPRDGRPGRCFERIAQRSVPCEFCPLEDIITGRRSYASGVLQREDRRYVVTVCRVPDGNGMPLGLHFMRRVSSADLAAWVPESDAATSVGSVRRRGSASLRPASPGPMIGTSPSWRRVEEVTRTLASYPETGVLLLGETGTGKDTVARTLHHRTHGSGAPFVPISCASIPAELLESELFGHEKGAFTGAIRRKPGLFELADGGTLFLDEVGELSLALQPKLLRALETKTFIRLGGVHPVRIDCRVVCASNSPLREHVASGAFREDLFHRLSTFTIELPPLRERPDDLPLLVRHFLDQAHAQLGKHVPGFAPDALRVLSRYAWPGNVRELRKAVERAVILTEPGARIQTTALPAELFDGRVSEVGPILPLREAVRRYLEQAVTLCGGNRRKAARLLQISRTTLRAKLGPAQEARCTPPRKERDQILVQDTPREPASG